MVGHGAGPLTDARWRVRADPLPSQTGRIYKLDIGRENVRAAVVGVLAPIVVEEQKRVAGPRGSVQVV